MTGHRRDPPPGPAPHQNFFFFFFADWLHNRIPREWAGVGRPRAAWGGKKWALSPADNAIISAPLARNARFHRPLLLSVRQSKLRPGPAGFRLPSPSPFPFPPKPPPAQPRPRDPTRSSDPPQTRSYKLIPGSTPPPSLLAGVSQGESSRNLIARGSIPPTDKQSDSVGVKTARRANKRRIAWSRSACESDEPQTTRRLQLLAPEFVSSLWRRCKS